MVKRIIRYLKGKPRVAIRYKFQEESENITVYTDSDWAGDEVTRRSTSRGVVCRGSHTISWWCKSSPTSHCPRAKRNLMQR